MAVSGPWQQPVNLPEYKFQWSCCQHGNYIGQLTNASRLWTLVTPKAILQSAAILFLCKTRLHLILEARALYFPPTFIKWRLPMNCVYPVFVSSQQGLQGHSTRYDGIYNRSDRHLFLTALLKEHLQNQVCCVITSRKKIRTKHNNPDSAKRTRILNFINLIHLKKELKMNFPLHFSLCGHE